MKADEARKVTTRTEELARNADGAVLGALLQADRNEQGNGGIGWLAQAQTTLPFVAALEKSLYWREEPDEGGIDGRAGVALGLQSARAVLD